MCRGELSCEIDVDVEGGPLVDDVDVEEIDVDEIDVDMLGWRGFSFNTGRGFIFTVPLLGWRGRSCLNVRTAKSSAPSIVSRLLLSPAARSACVAQIIR